MPPSLPGPLLILANGEMPPVKLARALAKRAVGVLCTDGSYSSALKMGLKPRWVIGDFDSLPPKQEIRRGTILVFDDDPELSDFEKAFIFAKKFGRPEVWVLGALGKRLDHALANLQTIEKYSKELGITLFTEHETARIIRKDVSFETRPGKRISLFPALDPAVVTSSGLKFPLKAEELARGSRGVSNQSSSQKVGIRLHSGALWLIIGKE